MKPKNYYLEKWKQKRCINNSSCGNETVMIANMIII